MLYIQEEIQKAIRYNHQRDSYQLSLPYEIVWEYKNDFVTLDDDWNEIMKLTIAEFQIGAVTMYGFDTVYNPDNPIGLVRMVTDL